ncbi:unnamed protein product [Amoebophrya sp. A25]|nr:unnamed protein product [Amoebophrya sp. A25]|eukprot:GSA25T00002790001.1
MGGVIGGNASKLDEVWEHFHRANVHLANAHHTSRNVPQTGDLAQAIRNATDAENFVHRHATLTPNQRLMLYGPREEVNSEEAQSKIEFM